MARVPVVSAWSGKDGQPTAEFFLVQENFCGYALPLPAHNWPTSMQPEAFAESKWRDDTRKLLHDRPASLTLTKIAEDCGVSEAWLRLFARGKIENPGVATVECLHKYLKAYKA